MDARRIPLDQVREGMVLAKPACDRGGGVLAQEGAVLDARLLLRLRACAVSFVEVRAEPPAGAHPAEDPRIEARIDEVLARKFEGFEDDERMSLIREVARSHLLERRRIPS